ncbi:MAG: 50S ribosomal protein L24 [Candidatus Pacearchaeota archaeon]
MQYIKMKKKFSTAWKGSKQPRKQRKYVAKAPLHIKRKLLSVNLSKDLRKKVGKRNVVVRKGDNVKVMTGKFKGKTGKIIQVFTKKSKVTVEGIQVKKQDGSKANIKLHPSNLQIIEMDMNDKKRISNKKTESKNKTENKK